MKRPNTSDLLRDGTKFYSDFSVNISKNCVWPRIAKCRECDTISWLRNLNRVKPKVVYDESLVADIKDVGYLDLEDYFTVLSSGIVENETDEVLVRRNIWWLYNDRVKLGKPIYKDKDDLKRWTNNIEHYLRLLETTGIVDKVVIAEINRNLGEFDNCISILNSIEDDQWLEYRKRLIAECERKNRWVVEIKRTGPLKRKYKIEVRELLSKVVEVKASSVEEAIDKVKEMYRTEEIMLDWKNCVGTEIDEYEEWINSVSNAIYMKPSKQLRKKYNTDYYERSAFASKARLLQSIWRTEKGYEFKKYGNLLELYFAKESGANFLTPEIFELVKHEVANKHIDRKVIQEPRIWNNLLSSQPLAFNLFGELKLDLGLATAVFKDLYPKRQISSVTAIEFEYSPGRGNFKYTGDSSAFDVFIVYENIQHERCFFGIEVKYAEDLNDTPASHKDVYATIAEKSGVFEMTNLPRLKEKPLQQIWRDHLLALSMFITNDDYAVGDFIYLYPSDNSYCDVGVEAYKTTLNGLGETYFKPLTTEKIVETIKSHCADRWIEEFEDRYLDFGKIDKQLA